jgi:hypothetical protein
MKSVRSSFSPCVRKDSNVVYSTVAFSQKRSERSRGQDLFPVEPLSTSILSLSRIAHRSFRNLLALIRILVPKVFCSEVDLHVDCSHSFLSKFSSRQTLFLALVAASLVARTYADVWIITNSTSVESAIIGRNPSLFKENLAKFAYAMPLVRPNSPRPSPTY